MADDSPLTAELDGWAKILAATPAGPWAVTERHGRDIADEGWSEVLIAGPSGPLAATYVTGIIEPGEDIGPFAVAAREAMPRMEKALRAALELHAGSVNEDYPQEAPLCGECGEWSPCATTSAISSALLGQDAPASGAAPSPVTGGGDG